ncbi:MAG TPA: hypothetical protein VGJ26_08840 [Pirellulales bacterium]
MTDADSLANIIRPTLPKSWTLSIKDNRVILERDEPIELYNSLAMHGGDRKAQIKERVFKKKMTISLWVGEHMTKDELEKAYEKNNSALDEARKDKKDGKFMPDEKFFRANPKYGYRKTPIVEAGRSSIYMECESHCIRMPIAGPRPPREEGKSYVIEFYDERIEKECQQFIDDVGNLFKPYY